MAAMVKLNRKLKEEGFIIEQGGRDWFGRRGDAIGVKRWRDDQEESAVLCRSLAAERAKRAAVGKTARGLRTRCEEAIAEAVRRRAPVFVVFAYRGSSSDGSQEAVWPENEALDLVRVANPVYVDGAWLIGEEFRPDTAGAGLEDEARELRLVLRKVRPDQVKFAEAVFNACNGRCIITRVQAGAVLDAAHRPGRSWEAGHNSASDGWLLRADVHRALDAGLISIAADGSLVYCDPVVGYIGTEYKARSSRGARGKAA